MYKERVAEILKANKDDSDMLDFVEERVNSLIEYVKHVSFMETRIQRIEIEGIRGEEYRDIVSSLDERRRDKHESAMRAATQLNRIAAASGLEPFYDGPIDDQHRYIVGDMCAAVVNEYFEDRHAKPLTLTDLMGNDEEFVSAVTELSQQADAIQR